MASVGCLAYLEPARAATGALRVVPGSHTDLVAAGPGVAVETDPGDAIVFDEHLLHGSTGGGVRRQWRADFVVDPGDAGEESAVRAWFAESLPDEAADPGYAADRYPSYGPYLAGPQPSVAHPPARARRVRLGRHRGAVTADRSGLVDGEAEGEPAGVDQRLLRA